MAKPFQKVSKCNGKLPWQNVIKPTTVPWLMPFHIFMQLLYCNNTEILPYTISFVDGSAFVIIHFKNIFAYLSSRVQIWKKAFGWLGLLKNVA